MSKEIDAFVLMGLADNIAASPPEHTVRAFQGELHGVDVTAEEIVAGAGETVDYEHLHSIFAGLTLTQLGDLAIGRFMGIEFESVIPGPYRSQAEVLLDEISPFEQNLRVESAQFIPHQITTPDEARASLALCLQATVKNNPDVAEELQRKWFAAQLIHERRRPIRMLAAVVELNDTGEVEGVCPPAERLVPYYTALSVYNARAMFTDALDDLQSAAEELAAL